MTEPKGTLSDLDIYRAAKLLVDKHGEKASIHAVMRADGRLAACDMDGRATWLRVLAAVKKLLVTKPEIGVSIH